MKFLVSRTYSEWTPESSVDGEYSDTGFVFEDVEYTLRELIEYIRSERAIREGRSSWLTTGSFAADYATGTEREECIHVTLPRRS